MSTQIIIITILIILALSGISIGIYFSVKPLELKWNCNTKTKICEPTETGNLTFDDCRQTCK